MRKRIYIDTVAMRENYSHPPNDDTKPIVVVEEVDHGGRHTSFFSVDVLGPSRVAVNGASSSAWVETDAPIEGETREGRTRLV